MWLSEWMKKSKISEISKLVYEWINEWISEMNMSEINVSNEWMVWVSK